MKSLCYLLLLPLVFAGCELKESEPIPTKSNQVNIIGKVTDITSGKPLPGIHVALYYVKGFTSFGCTGCFEGDTITDKDGNYTFRFNTSEFGYEYTLECISDSFIKSDHSLVESQMYAPILAKFKIVDYRINYIKDFALQSASLANISFKNTIGNNETINGYFVINGDTEKVFSYDVMGYVPSKYGPIRPDEFEKEYSFNYMDNVSFKATISRPTKPTIVVEKTFTAGPSRTQKIELEYQ